MSIALVIPVYEPTLDFVDFCIEIKKANIENVLIVNDGSGEAYEYIFSEVKEKCGFTLLEHSKNRGKGRALKTAFEYLINDCGTIEGCVTADSDGQHMLKDILSCMVRLQEEKNTLVLGCRDFDGPDIPNKSRYGNRLTSKMFEILYKKKISDTQTGLRGIQRSFMETLINVEGERFEFETQMLIEACKRGIEIVEVPIETIYDSKENHKTHFNPIKDSIQIYKLFLGQFARFVFSGFSSFLLDVIVFAVVVELFRNQLEEYILVATVLARSISAVYNYIMNYKFVFNSKSRHLGATVKYFILAFGVMLCSGFGVSVIHSILPVWEIVIKILVDSLLFVSNYFIQKKWVFKK